MTLAVLGLHPDLLRGPDDLEALVQEAYDLRADGQRVLVLVPPRGRGPLEDRAAAADWAGLALDRAGLSVGLAAVPVDGPAGEAPGPDAAALSRDLARRPVVLAVVPGGSDPSRLLARALELAVALEARTCRLVAGGGPGAWPARARWSAAMVEQAGRLTRAPELRAPGSEGTPPRVLLSGLGPVGGTVLRALQASPSRGLVQAVLHPGPPRRDGAVPVRVDQPAALLDHPADVLVETRGGASGAWLVEHALRAGLDVVSCDPDLVARRGPELERLARRQDLRWGRAACVGGALPVLETLAAVEAPGQVTRVTALLDPAANAVLDGLAEGLTLCRALARVEARGLAGAGVAERLDAPGADALVVLARAAFGAHRPQRWSLRGGLDEDAARVVREAGQRPRLLARAELRDGAVRLWTGQVSCAADDPWARLGGERGRVELVTADGGEQVLEGRVAGSWPVAAALLADLARGRRAAPSPRRPALGRAG